MCCPLIDFLKVVSTDRWPAQRQYIQYKYMLKYLGFALHPHVVHDTCSQAHHKQVEPTNVPNSLLKESSSKTIDF